MDTRSELAQRPAVGATISLGRRTFKVVGSTALGLELEGPRGGRTHLIQNLPRPRNWCHSEGQRGTWYRLNADGTFEQLVG